MNNKRIGSQNGVEQCQKLIKQLHMNKEKEYYDTVCTVEVFYIYTTFI